MNRLGNNPALQPRVEPVVVEPDPWVKVLSALDQLAASIRDMAAPVVHVPAPDMTEIVTAVMNLKGPATADEIAEAVARALRRDPEPENTTTTELVEALKKLDFRLKGQGTQAYGGGAVSFSPAGLRQLTEAVAAADDVAEPTVVVETVTASGDTTLHTPASGKAIRLRWISAINDPDEATSPLIKVLLGADEVYRAYAVAHRETFTGAANAALVVNLSGAASVAVTAHIEEVDP